MAIIKPNNKLNIADNFFYMCFGKIPQKEIVKEVAKRVARRLQEAKQAQAKLNEALGKK